MAQLSLSTLADIAVGEPRVPTKINTALVEVRDHINNALIGTDNITNASLLDTDLASPNNSVWRPVFQVGGSAVAGGTTAGTYGMASGIGAVVLSTGPNVFPIPVWHSVGADLAVAGKTTQVRVRADVVVNATAPAVNFTVGLYPITASGGANNSTITYTIGSVVASALFTTPSASIPTRAEGTAVSLPAAGSYLFAVVVSGTASANSLSSITAVLEMRHN